jgi:hypothetical protein
MAKCIVTVNPKRGRPAIFVGVLKTNIVRLLRAHGLVKTQRILASEGVSAKVGAKKSPVKISLPTLSKLATEAGIEFKRGRPALAA